MKKIAAMLLCFCLLCTGPVTAFAQTIDETGEAGATISAVVPNSHVIAVTADHATVSMDGQTGSSLTVERLSEPQLLIRPDSGYRVIKVTLNGEDITGAISGGYYTLSPVYEDKALVVQTAAAASDEDSSHDISGTITDENGDPIPGVTVDVGGHTDVTDENGEFTIEGVPDGYHPVTVTDKDGNIIGYTEIELGEGETGAEQSEDGGYTLTAPEDASLSLDLTVTADGKLIVEKIADITPQPEQPGTGPQTGESGDMALYAVLLLSSAVCLTALTAARRKRASKM